MGNCYPPILFMPAANKIWGKGITQTKAGHLRYTSPKELRWQYVHRAIVIKAIKENPYLVKFGLIPIPFEVHHMDFCKVNNKPENLLLLDMRLHSAMTSHARGRDNRGVFIPRWGKASDWLPLYDNEDNIGDEEIPF